jgi:uncharacterized membrane protein YjgN (DUF898 family)
MISSTVKVRLVASVTIIATGIVTALSPALWVPLVWSTVSYGRDDVVNDIQTAPALMLPFVLIVIFHAFLRMSLAAAGLATIGCIAALVAAEYIAVDPNQTSTASIAIIVTPLLLLLAVTLTYLVDALLRWSLRLVMRQRRDGGRKRAKPHEAA